MEIDLHFIRERVALGEICVLHVPDTIQCVYVFTKGLPTSVFTEYRSSLNIHPPNTICMCVCVCVEGGIDYLGCFGLFESLSFSPWFLFL